MFSINAAHCVCASETTSQPGINPLSLRYGAAGTNGHQRK
jgi:hypothetical protein